MKKEHTCETCRWALALDCFVTPTFECHRFPPTYCNAEEPNWSFPIVNAFSGCDCGDYQQDELDDKNEIAERRMCEGCASCRYSTATIIDKGGDGKREEYLCHRHASVYVPDNKGGGHFTQTRVDYDPGECFCGECDLRIEE